MILKEVRRCCETSECGSVGEKKEETGGSMNENFLSSPSVRLKLWHAMLGGI